MSTFFSLVPNNLTHLFEISKCNKRTSEKKWRDSLPFLKYLTFFVRPKIFYFRNNIALFGYSPFYEKIYGMCSSLMQIKTNTKLQLTVFASCAKNLDIMVLGFQILNKRRVSLLTLFQEKFRTNIKICFYIEIKGN